MEQYLLPHTATVIEALDRLNRLSGGTMTLFVTDDSGIMLGSLTDGDVRRSLLAGLALDSAVTQAINRRFKAVTHDMSDLDIAETLRSLREKGIRLVPRLDNDGRITEIIDLTRTATRLPLTAILMAGGMGERLRPMTLTRPKPLLEIEGKAIIDYNIEALAAAGITDINVTTRYLAEQIAEHFAAPVAGVQVKCVVEDLPLGTIGSATLVDIPANGHTLVMNSDLLTSISFEEMFINHAESGADITIAVIPYQVSVPFAILSLDGSDVTGLQEKPCYSYYANAGIYMMRNKILHTLVPGQRTDATDLIERTIEAGGSVKYYPIKGTWIDIGSPTDFRQASELMRHHRSLGSK